MLDLSTISQETLIARGQYATVRGKHENAKFELSILCGELQSIPAQLLRHMQPNGGQIPGATEDMIARCRDLVDQIERLSGEIESLARQRAELKVKAWPKE